MFILISPIGLPGAGPGPHGVSPRNPSKELSESLTTIITKGTKQITKYTAINKVLSTSIALSKTKDPGERTQLKMDLKAAWDTVKKKSREDEMHEAYLLLTDLGFNDDLINNPEKISFDDLQWQRIVGINTKASNFKKDWEQLVKNAHDLIIKEKDITEFLKSR